MNIEKVIIKKTLKAGKETWEEGTVLRPPLPPDIQREVDLGMDTVEVVTGEVRVFKPRVIRR